MIYIHCPLLRCTKEFAVFEFKILLIGGRRWRLRNRNLFAWTIGKMYEEEGMLDCENLSCVFVGGARLRGNVRTV